MKIALVLTTFSLVIGLSSNARAACDQDGSGNPSCSGTFYGSPVQEWVVKPDVTTLATHLPSISGTQWQQAIAQAASTWNENTNGRSFRVGSTVNMPDLLPQDDANCTASQRGIVQVIAATDGDAVECVGSVACAIGRCKYFDSFWGRNVSKSATIIIEGTYFNSAPWAVGLPASGEADLVSTFTHELGHVVNLTHPASASAVMGAGATGSIFRRDLFQWDLECASECALARTSPSTDRRSISLRTRQMDSSSPFFSAESTPSIAALSDASTSFVKSGSSWVIARSETSTQCTSGHAWAQGLTTTATCLSTTPFAFTDAIGPVSGLFRQDETMQYIFYAGRLDVSTGGSGLTHQVRYARSSTGFSSSASAQFNKCTSMSGWMTCTGTTGITSGEPPALTWLAGNVSANDPNGVSVFAWSDMLRDDTSSDRRVHVAVGRVGVNVVPIPDVLAVQTNISPAVACKINYSSTFDCLLVYAPVDDALNTLKALRFSLSAGTTRYTVTPDANGPVIVRDGNLYPALSANRPALALIDNIFVLVVRSSRSNQNLEAFYSSNGTSWTYINETLGYSSVAPHVQTSWPESTIVKQIVYAR